jgi:hypothetical protein
VSTRQRLLCVFVGAFVALILFVVFAPHLAHDSCVAIASQTMDRSSVSTSPIEVSCP